MRQVRKRLEPEAAAELERLVKAFNIAWPRAHEFRLIIDLRGRVFDRLASNGRDHD
jgi:hypothetical protein